MQMLIPHIQLQYTVGIYSSLYQSVGCCFHIEGFWIEACLCSLPYSIFTSLVLKEDLYIVLAGST